VEAAGRDQNLQNTGISETMSTSVKTVAPLGNVSAFSEMMDRLVRRAPHLPGLAVFYGHSGVGKTSAATYGAHRHQANYLEAGDSWTKKHFLEQLVRELGGQPHGTVPALVDKVIELLAITPRPIIIDEFDCVVRRGYHEVLREIHDKVPQATIVVIGEELLPERLVKSERWHNRVLDWLPAQPADVADARHLAALYCERLAIADDLLGSIVTASQGRVRRICVNLERVREAAQVDRRGEADSAWWGDRPLWTGKAPARRLA
jgi:DNA transposition AAA+ family ATPase